MRASSPRSPTPSITSIYDDLDLIRAVDDLREGAEPLSSHEFAYARLHGLNDDPYDYDYEYATDELGTLAGSLSALADDRERVYCLFNNFGMYADARELRSML